MIITHRLSPEEKAQRQKEAQEQRLQQEYRKRLLEECSNECPRSLPGTSLDSSQRLDPTGRNGSTYDTIRQVIPAGGDLASIHLTRIFSPFFVNTAQVGPFYAHTTMMELAGSNSVTPSFTRPSDFIMNHLFAANDGDPSLPDVKMSSKGVPFKFTENTFVRHYNANLFDIVDSATLQRGHQSFKFGFYLDKYQKNEPLEFRSEVTAQATGDRLSLSRISRTIGESRPG